jgi:hypothetical protein
MRWSLSMLRDILKEGGQFGQTFVVMYILLIPLTIAISSIHLNE